MSWLDTTGQSCDYLNARWHSHEQTLPDPWHPGEFVRAHYSHRTGSGTEDHPVRNMQCYTFRRTSRRTQKTMSCSVWCNSKRAFLALLIFWDNQFWRYESV